MGAESHFEVWLVIAVLAFFIGAIFFHLLVEVPGRLLLKAVVSDFEPTTRMSRAVGLGIWGVIFMIIHAVTS